MSIIIVQLAPQGILFGADRNITSQRIHRDGRVVTTVSGQSQRPKVLKWPNQEVIVGYVGQAEFDGIPADRWLYSFIGRNLTFNSLDTVARLLTRELDDRFRAGQFDQPSIWHLAGFERVGGEWTPRIYFIRNTIALTDDGAYQLGRSFDCSEELEREIYFGTKSGRQIRNDVAGTYWSFRQGFDLGAFNTIDGKLREAMLVLIDQHPLRIHQAPVSLDEWEKHLSFAVHGYGAYFAAFYPPFAQYVGGGADVVAAVWPDE